MSITHLASEALKLSPHDRAVLAETIWESLEDPFIVKTEISDREAIILAKRRDLEIEQGNVRALSHKELITRLRDEH